MNRNLYRIIFNKARNVFIVVSELVKSHQMVASNKNKVGIIYQKHGSIYPAKPFKIKPLIFISYIALGMVSLIDSCYATNIVADKTADRSQRPDIYQHSDGIKIINITNPSSSGVSHNKYTQFDVSKKGVILNNGTDRYATQLVEFVNGNISLTQSAKVILNEVNSPNISQLNGYIEVAGPKAQVIIANPAGITCNGCGFINADRATLTTGKPLVENGKLTGYQVERGHIYVTGQGLKNTGQDYTDIIARSVKINAELWANKEINVIAGQNNVGTDLSFTENKKDEIYQDRFNYGIDVSALGGMYAGKITLSANEQGVGVRNSGTLGVSAGDLNINANGIIINNNYMMAKDSINFNSSEIRNNTTIESGKNLNIQSQYVENFGKISAGEQFTADSGYILNTNDIKSKNVQLKAQYVKNYGVIEASNDITMKANNTYNANKILAENNIALSGYTIFNDKQSLIQSQNQNIQLNSSIFENQGTIKSYHLYVNSDDFINNSTGNIEIGKYINIKGSSFKNYGLVKSSVDLDSSVIHLNNYGKLLSDRININAFYFINAGKGELTANSISLTGSNLENYNVIYGGENLSISEKEYLYNQGELNSKGDLSIYGKIFKNDWNGRITSYNISLSSEKLENHNLIEGYNNLTINATDLYNQGELSSFKSALISQGYFKNDWNGFVKGSNITITGKNFENHNQVTAEKLLSIDSTKVYNQGTLASEQTLNTNSDYLINDWKGQMQGYDINISGEKFENNNIVDVYKTMSIKSKDVYNQGKLISEHTIDLTPTKLFNDWNGVIIAGLGLSISGNEFENHNLVRSNTVQKIDVDKVYNQGQLIGDKELYIKAKKVNNDWHGKIYGINIYVDVPELINNGLIIGDIKSKEL
ncbi:MULTISPECIES: filamentous hemagglutinin N-terminal domain-containing protein [unclassified Gilliamella]|uniref:two-partner secretion domain-containing protein n=1 Tax=unclassified Gilliamella TaxID=2685620 RepID=UPI002269D484|nr:MULTISPECIES: filamentous hemagglutinin N-terminal domain-containing protein [unclassified Gilliamella]MCX8573765.1 filamentous hemagglutinin N-terminal domain-containing protein [Gilliamella sp. B3831]MCX8575607.1 filamentous hemagglutinin N-terminal domain-containing protein [Gilliamella sp. B3815]MCX8589808.1 filamentous hemagglutinin N-terminal domain-containing protein [Gilliamella sp. B3812]MCX8602709.1 filamentous hemagglutinin N-terminal domain-containing protein [Gilliamella sp. B38